MDISALTPDRLTPLLRRHLGSDARCAAVTRGAIGNGQELWFLEVEQGGARRGLVLRRSAEGSALPWTDRAREFAVLRAVAGHGIPVPAPLWLETAPSSLARPYLVMERAPGAPLRRPDEATRRAVAHQLGTALARLHALPPDGLGLDLPRPPDGAAAARAELHHWRDRYQSQRLAPVPLLGALFAWLEVNAPADAAPVVLLWGDPGPHNVLMADGRVSALLDWELAHLGHPLDDLGAAVWACLDVLDPAVVVKAYERERDAPVDHQTLRWFECLASVSRSVMLLEGVRAYVEGRTARPAVAGLGLELLAASLERAVAAAGWRAARAPGTRPSGDAQDEERVAPPAPLPGPAGIARGVARFLREEALAAVGDAALRGSLRVAAALLETAALRAEAEPAVQAERVRAARALLEELAEAGVDAGDLEVAAVQVESLDAFAGLRERVRGHLVDDLAVTRALLMPLHDLYGSPPPDRARWGSPQ